MPKGAELGLAKVESGRVRVEKNGRVGSGSKNKVDPNVENTGRFVEVASFQY